MTKQSLTWSNHSCRLKVIFQHFVGFWIQRHLLLRHIAQETFHFAVGNMKSVDVDRIAKNVVQNFFCVEQVINHHK